MLLCIDSMHSSIHKDGTDKAAPPLDVTDKAAPPLDVTDKAAPPLDVTDKAAPPLDVTDKAAPPLLDVLCGQSIVNVMNVLLIARQKFLSAKAPKNNHMSVVVFGGLPEKKFLPCTQLEKAISYRLCGLVPRVPTHKDGRKWLLPNPISATAERTWVETSDYSMRLQRLAFKTWKKRSHSVPQNKYFTNGTK